MQYVCTMKRPDQRPCKTIGRKYRDSFHLSHLAVKHCCKITMLLFGPDMFIEDVNDLLVVHPNEDRAYHEL